jgi:exopolyphosphatase/guanosine-5'-triphosphate,3'-diphosphate pyrophosphatase
VRLGVLDVGSNTVHLLLVDAHEGAAPVPAYKSKEVLRLSELLTGTGKISSKGEARLIRFCADARELAEDKGAEEILAFATSAMREATNGEQVVARVREETGVQLSLLSGEAEARLTFLAVRRWFGWSSRRLLVLDIGGGSLEIATGIDELPDAAVSLPLGAGRLTSDWLPEDPPSVDELRELRRHARARIASSVGMITRFGSPDLVVGTSKTFRSLARISGAAAKSEGPYVPRTLSRTGMDEALQTIVATPTEQRTDLPGVSSARARQLPAGALVADAAMDLFEAPEILICPWALREGVILRRMDGLSAESL